MAARPVLQRNVYPELHVFVEGASVPLPPYPYSPRARIAGWEGGELEKQRLAYVCWMELSPPRGYMGAVAEHMFREASYILT